jgi:hypothetical protein
VEIPPGCEDQPDTIGQIRSLIADDPALDSRCACITADAVTGDAEFVDLLIREWLSKDSTKQYVWQKEVESIADLPVAQRLKAFFNICVVDPERRRIVLVRRFDRIFRGMSSELLAVLRDLEHELLLITVSASPLTYEELYRRRSRTQPGFTSDYGQTHVRLTVGILSIDDAERIWKEHFRLPLETRLNRAYFETAYTISGGLPTAFGMAAGYTTNLQIFAEDVRPYGLALMDQLPSAFTRLLGYDEEDEKDRLVQAVARLHIGAATNSDRQIIRGHRWNFLLLADNSTDLQLRTEALGRKALEILRLHRSNSELQPDILYDQGQYLACCDVLQGLHFANSNVFFLAATIMAEVFGDSPKSLYFGPKVKWHIVKKLAQQACDLCQDRIGQLEFKHWIRIAEVHEGYPSKVNLKSEMPKDEKGTLCRTEDTIIRLAIRVLAVANDRNAVTAAYTGIPLIEDVLRHYVSLVLDLPLTATAFSDIDTESIAAWWKEAKVFKTPEENASLNVTHLALLAAVISAKKEKPLFTHPTEMSRLLRLQDRGRNMLGHNVLTPPAQLSQQLVEQTTILLDRMCLHLDSGLSVKEIESWVKPPKHFLTTQLKPLSPNHDLDSKDN